MSRADAVLRAAQDQRPLWAANPYYEGAEPWMKSQWEELIWPRIQGLDFTSVVDLACGRGRNSAYLQQVAGSLLLVDLSPENVEACRERFRGRKNVSCVVGDGVSIPAGDASVTLVYTWDAMVHFAPEVVHAYLAETRRVLRPGGAGFFHHSNFTGTDETDFPRNPHARNWMDARLFRYWARSLDLEVVSSDLLDWGGGAYRFHALDAVTVVRRPE